MSIFDEFGSLKREGGITLKDLAEKLGVHPPKLSQIQAGKAGFSPTVARKAAEVYEESPATVYLTSQVRSLKYRLGLEDLSPASVLQSAGLTIKGLQGFDTTERDEDDPEFIEAAEELGSIAEKALMLDTAAGAGPFEQRHPSAAAEQGANQGPVTKNSGKSDLDALGRDTEGRKIAKLHTPERVKAATKSRGVSLDQFGRKPDGTRPKGLV